MRLGVQCVASFPCKSLINRQLLMGHADSTSMTYRSWFRSGMNSKISGFRLTAAWRTSMSVSENYFTVVMVNGIPAQVGSVGVLNRNVVLVDSAFSA